MDAINTESILVFVKFVFFKVPTIELVAVLKCSRQSTYHELWLAVMAMSV